MNFSVKESGELLDADHISEEKMALGISEAVYENVICISPLKGNIGAEIVREVQKQMTGFQTTGDCSVDLGKTSQRIKMTRKGLPGAGGTPQKADQLAKEKISAQIKAYAERSVILRSEESAWRTGRCSSAE